MARVGYARVSTVGQNLDVQMHKLHDCDKLFTEKVSARTSNRPQLQNALDWVRDGDFFVVTKLDRLARSTRDLLNIVSLLDSKRVELVVLDQNIDTYTPTGRLLLSLLGSVAQFENDLRKERQSEGIALAKSKGVTLGRKPSLTDAQIQNLRQKRLSGVLVKDLMTEFNISKASVYRYLGVDSSLEPDALLNAMERTND